MSARNFNKYNKEYLVMTTLHPLYRIQISFCLRFVCDKMHGVVTCLRLYWLHRGMSGVCGVHRTSVLGTTYIKHITGCA